MKRPEYMKVHISKFPDDIIERYDLRVKCDKNGFIFIQITKGMYGLKQAAILAYNQLVIALAPAGYYPAPHTVGLWCHKSKPTKFCLCVDDFGVKYYSKVDADHFLNALRAHYKISVDWDGHNYYGLTLAWDYPNGYVDISMNNYVRKQMLRYQHSKPSSPQWAPHQWTVPSYGSKIQFAHEDSTLPLDDKDKKLVQSIAGAFLYYGRAVDPTILPALTDIASAQSNPTTHTMDACHMLMDYLYTYPNATIRFYKSDMILYIDYDAAYLQDHLLYHSNQRPTAPF